MTGKRIMVLPHPFTLQNRRNEHNDPTDLPVPVFNERLAFLTFATKFGWTLYAGESPSELYAKSIVNELICSKAMMPTDACGPVDAPVVFLGERGSDGPPPPGAWLPFSSKYTMQYARILGDKAMQCAWTNMSVDPRELLEQAKLIVACGHIAQEYVTMLGLRAKLLGVPHPASLYRWGRMSAAREVVEQQIKYEVFEVLRELAPAR
jgi:hypothetical protein